MIYKSVSYIIILSYSNAYIAIYSPRKLEFKKKKVAEFLHRGL